jgi:hypothetical protein
MDNQEQFSVPSRAEYIKLARESCNKNFTTTLGNSKNQKQKYTETKLPVKSSWDQISNSYDSTIPSKGFNLSNMSIKILLVRTVLALLLFLTVLLFDKLDLSVKTLNSGYIEKMVTSNQTIEEAENYFVNLFEKFVKSE